MAIVLVVCYHAIPWAAPRGFLGVDVFFVISGYLITGFLSKEMARTGTIDLAAFWARRARRLLPAGALVALATIALFVSIESPFYVAYTKTAISFALFASNLRFALRGNGDYFAPSTAEDPLLHTWSLSAEEQFYFAIAPSIWLLAWSSRSFETYERRATRLIAWIGAGSFVGAVLLNERFPIGVFYLLPTRMWELGIGCAMALQRQSLGFRSRSVASGLSVLALAGLIATATWRSTTTQWNPISALVAVAATAVLIMAGASGGSGQVTRVLASKPFTVVGRLSYSWYLWHWPLLVATRVLVDEPSTAELLTVAMVALALSAVTFVAVESPVRQSVWLSAKPSRSLALGALLSVTTFCAAIAATEFSQRRARRPEFEIVRAAQMLPRIYAGDCHSSLGTPDPVSCNFGKVDAETTLVLFGDSHAAQWFPALEAIATARGWRLSSYTKPACPSVDVSVGYGVPTRLYQACDRWRSAVISQLRNRPPHLVIISNSDAYVLADGDEWLTMPASTEARTAWSAGLRKTLQALTAEGMLVAVLHDVPNLAQDPARCLARRHRTSACSLRFDARLEDELRRSERDILRGVEGVSWVDLNGYICGAVPCPATRDGMLVYRDPHHLSVQFVLSLTDILESALPEITIGMRRRP